MDHLWGISGTVFLLVYGVVLVALVVFAVGVRRRVLEPVRGRAVAGGELVATAFLAGGRSRVVEFSVARLIAAGAARVNRDGMVTGLAVVPEDPLDAAVLKAMGNRPRRRYDVVSVVSRSDEVWGGHVEAVERSLVERGQVITAGVVRGARRAMLLGPGLLVVVGLVRWVHGLAADRPVGLLTVELVVTAMVIQALRVLRFPARTRLGERTLADARAGATGMARVALHGLSEYPDAEIRAALRGPAPRARSRGHATHSGADTTLLAGGVVAGYGDTTSGSGGGDGGGSGGGGCGSGGGCGGCGGCG